MSLAIIENQPGQTTEKLETFNKSTEDKPLEQNPKGAEAAVSILPIYDRTTL